MQNPILETQATPGAALVTVNGKLYPLESARIVARAEGGVAMTTLEQTWANPHDEALEVTYTLPLPADGAVLGYTIRMGEKIIRAEVQPREKADRAYRKALYEGRTAGLLEQTRPDTFQQRLGNVPPRTRVEISIDVLHPVAFLPAVKSPGNDGAPGAPSRDDTGRSDAACWEYRFPTVTSVRYHGGEGRVPDRAALDPDRSNRDRGEIPARFQLALRIADEGGASARCTSHVVSVGPGDPPALVTLREGERLDRDVVVQWPAAAQEIGVRVVECGGLEGDDGRYVLVTVVPPLAPAVTFGRDLTVLLDASGSMRGEPLALAKRVIGDLLRSLEPGDRFEVLAFSNDVHRVTPGLLPMGEWNLRGSLNDLDRVQAGGGTEMAKAVTAALEPKRQDAQRQVVLVTDGHIGFEAEVVARIAGSRNTRLHAVGIGSAPNRSLTRQAAAAGRGLEVLVGDAPSAARAASRLIAGTARPVLTSLELGGTALTGEKPGGLRDVFAGQPLVFSVELSRVGGDLTLRGELAGSSEPWSARVTVPVAHGAVPASNAEAGLAKSPLPIGAFHGRAAIAELEILLADPELFASQETDARIEALGMRHRIASRRTSLVAISDEPSVDPGKPRRVERLAVELPRGVSAEGVGLLGSAGAVNYLEPDEIGSLLRVSEEQIALSGMIDSPRMAYGVRETSARFSRPAHPPSPQVLHAETGRIEPMQVELTFKVTFDGFLVPSGFLFCEEEGVELRIVSCSANSGPQKAGTRVTLSILIETGLFNHAGEVWTLSWMPRAQEETDDAGFVVFRLEWLVPDLRQGS